MRGAARALRLAGLLLPLLVQDACKPVRYLFGWRARLAPDTTAAAGGAVLVGAGDIGMCGLLGAKATAALIRQIPGTVVTLGDNAYPDGSARDFAECYEPTWGAFRDRTRPTPGNHEYHDGRGGDYWRYFGAAAGDPGRGYYSYEVGDWHVVALNSNIDVAASSDQVRWLRADLAAHPRRCTLAYFHHALFSSSRYATPAMRDVWRALEDAGADVVLAAHHHAYERFAPQRADGTRDSVSGIREFVVGTGGGGLDAFGRRARNSEKRYNGNYAVLRLQLFVDGYAWRLVSVNGHLRDAGRDRCH